MTYDIIPTGFIYMQEKAKQYPEAELLLFECYSLSLCILSIAYYQSKLIWDILKNMQKTSVFVLMWLYLNFNENKGDNAK